MLTITIKADEFTYPTREELKQIRPHTPRLKPFGFPYVHELLELLNNMGSMESVARKSNLHWWDHCLVSRLGSLSHAYTTALVHYNRGLPDEVQTYQHEHFVNRTQFGYYGETYFYFFISVRDTVAQVFNIYFSMEIPENQLFLNDQFLKKITDQKVRDLLIQFLDDTKKTSDFRNGLAHRYLITQPDNRPTVTYERGMMFGSGRGDEITSSELMAEIKRSMSGMAKFLDDLRPLMQL